MSKFTTLSVKLGIGLLVLAVGAVVVARMWCPTASERANAISLEEVQSQAKSLENSRKLAKVGKELAEIQFGSAEREEKLNELISLLDPEIQAYVKSLPREDRLDAIHSWDTHQIERVRAVTSHEQSKSALLLRQEHIASSYR